MTEPLQPMSLEERLAGGHEPIDLLKTIHNKYHDDPSFADIVKSPKKYKNFELTDQLLYLKTNNN